MIIVTAEVLFGAPCLGRGTVYADIATTRHRRAIYSRSICVTIIKHSVIVE